MTGEAKGGAPRALKSAGAVLAGLLTVIVLSTAVDEIMHALHVFPPKSQVMTDPVLYWIALTYRAVIAAIGGWLTARLAPARPMAHVTVLAGIGFVLGLLGVVAVVMSDLGPLWYAVAVAVTGPLFTWSGGRRYRGGKA